MKKTVIGITPLYDIERESIWLLPGYMEIIQKCGALPVILPFTDNRQEINDIFGFCDGILLPGGQDINPRLYGEAASSLCSSLCDARDSLEEIIFKQAYELDIPVFGICRGLQLINALLGGTLYKDIPSEYKSKTVHKMTKPYDKACHKVSLIENTPLYSLLKEKSIDVNSCHHQAVKTLSPLLKPMAVSEDGLIEAVYCPDKKFIQAVQWHPEFSYKKDSRQLSLINEFVKSCAD